MWQYEEMSRVLIAGCGYVGTALGLRLSQAGCEVFGLRREPTCLPSQIHPLAADLSSPDGLAGLPPLDFDFLVYPAAADDATESAYERAYVRGLVHMLKRLEQTSPGLRRTVFVSSTRVFPQSAGEWVDENDNQAPADYRGRILRQGEKVVTDCQVPSGVLRAGGIYGPSRAGMIRRVRNGAGCTADPPRYTNRIHRDDCAAVIQHLLNLADPAPLFLGVDNAPTPECEVMDWLARQIGVALPPRKQGKPGKAGKRCSNALLISSGFRFAFPTYREGYGSLLKEKTHP